MWVRSWAVAAVVGALVAGCGGGKKSSVFSPDNVYGSDMPGAATEVTPDDFAAMVQSGELTLITAKDAAQAAQTAQEQEAQDRAFLAGLTNPSEAVQLLLAAKPGLHATPGGDFVAQIPDPAGGTREVLTLGDAVMLRHVVTSYQESQDPARALAAYQVAFDAAPADVQAQAPSPASLAGAAAGAIRQALDALNVLLDARANLDDVQLAVAPQDVTIISGGAGAGGGLDGPAADACTFSDVSILDRLQWPLKHFLPPIKDQRKRNTCWAFTAVGAVETRERVVNDAAVDLSEQYFINVHKRDAILGIDFLGEGDFYENALDKFVDRDWPIATEDEWTFNPGAGRTSDDSLAGICDGYTGYCSETNHESPTSCARVSGDIFCGFQRITYQGASTVRASRSHVVWDNTIFDPNPPVAVMRQLIANGQVLMASFPILAGFDGNDRGYVTNLANEGNRGGHAVQLVGFATDSDASFAPTVAGGTGGGFFVVKNSWGYLGDCGYWYVPVRYLQSFFHDIRVLDMPATRSQAWTDALAALQPPQVVLSTLTGTDVPLNRPFTVHAALTGGGPGCCGLQWSPTPDSISGDNASYRFTTVGSQTITVTAQTALGETATGELVVNVVDGAPHAIITAPTSGVVFRGASVELIGYGLDPNEGPGPEDGVILDCIWTSSLGDGGPWSGCDKTVSFASNGSRDVTLSVLDAQGLSGEATVTLVVEDPPTNYPPVPSIGVADTVAGPLFDWDGTFTFTGGAVDPENNTPFTYHWTATALSETGVEGSTIDLGTTATVQWTPHSSYSFFFGSGACQAGNGQRVRVTLSVTDSAAQTGSTVTEVRVVCPPA